MYLQIQQHTNQGPHFQEFLSMLKSSTGLPFTNIGIKLEKMLSLMIYPINPFS
jgi:hypothetical protein